MDVPLALNHIEIRHGLREYRKSTAFSQQTDVVGLSALYTIIIDSTFDYWGIMSKPY